MKRLAILLFMLSTSALAQDGVDIHNGFTTGEQFLRMSDPEKRAFSMGTVNGMLLAPLFGAPKERMLRIESCVEGMTGSQIAAILEKYLRDNPSLWHQTPHTAMYAALVQTCPE